jgi:hypothetical protein
MTTQIGDPSRVRLADADDEGEIMELARLLHGEIGSFAFSEPKVRSMVQRAIDGPVSARRGLIGVIGPASSIEGMVYLEITSEYYTDELCLLERFNYVLPGHRKSSASDDLIAFSQSMSDQFGLPLLMGIFTNERTAAKARFYRRHLGEPLGYFFGHNLRTRGTA